MSYIQNNSIFWVEVDKISPNPFQPRRDFDSDKLKDLAESIKMYGLLQPLTVTRKEEEREDGSLVTTYELIAGERRLRASRLAGLVQVPVIIRSGEEDDRLKLELAIIENLQRDDLNPVERAIAFQQLVERFGFKHGAVAKRVGKSREYVSNTIRLLSLPEEIKKALSENKLSEGHTRPILMLRDRPKEQVTLFKEIIFKKLTVREAEAISRRIAYDKVRKQSRSYDPELVEMEDQLAESLGTRVFIEKRPVGGKITIDFFSNSDLKKILELLGKEKIELTSIEEIEKQSPQNTDSENSPESFMDEIIERKEEAESFEDDTAESIGEGLEDDSSSDEENQEIFGDKFSREDEKPINFSVPSY
ncbi:hypothetical protein COV42_02730, partial [Candidatus Campbellbacteria bacterium CG11_big_fil_rev_8_21_14_0_20_44_21]